MNLNARARIHSQILNALDRLGARMDNFDSSNEFAYSFVHSQFVRGHNTVITNGMHRRNFPQVYVMESPYSRHLPPISFGFALHCTATQKAIPWRSAARRQTTIVSNTE